MPLAAAETLVTDHPPLDSLPVPDLHAVAPAAQAADDEFFIDPAEFRRKAQEATAVFEKLSDGH